MKRLLLISIISTSFFTSVQMLQAQTLPVKQWDKTFEGSVIDNFSSIVQTSDGGYFIGGSSYSGISGDKSQASKGGQDYWVIKLDASGNKLWDKTIGADLNDSFHSLKQTSDGGYILGGESNSNINGDKTQASKGGHDYWVVKLDASGNKLWDKTFGGSNDDKLISIQQTVDGGYILGGKSFSGISGDKSQTAQGGFYDYWIVKLDALGNKVWDKTFGGSGSEDFSTVVQTTDGGYFIGGTSDSNISTDKSQTSKGGIDYWVIKTDALGNKQWDRTIGGSADDQLYSVQQVLNGGFILGGSSESGINGDKSEVSRGMQDYWVVKLDATGNKTWDKSFGGNDRDFCRSLQQTSDGGYILGGISFSPISADKTQANFANSDFWVVKLNGNGGKLWDKTFGGNNEDRLNSVQQTTDGGYILGGGSDSGISGSKSEISRGGDDFWIVKTTSDITGVKDIESNFNFSIFPNPSQGKFKLQLSNLNVPTVEVTISDLLGRIVSQKELHATENQISEELILPNTKGIYLLQLKVGEKNMARKIVVE